MRVRSPRISNGYQESSSSPSSKTMGNSPVESETTEFLPKGADPKDGNVLADKDGKQVEEKEIPASWDAQLWRFLQQPFTWISMLCR